MKLRVAKSQDVPLHCATLPFILCICERYVSFQAIKVELVPDFLLKEGYFFKWKVASVSSVTFYVMNVEVQTTKYLKY